MVGAGAIGLSVAIHLAQDGHAVTVLDKEASVGLHQSTRNSGVLHAGYNAKPGTAKARFCVEGNREARAFCQANGVALRDGGILVVARTPAEESTLDILHERAKANGTPTAILGPDEMREREPHAKGTRALWAQEAASVDSAGFVQALHAQAKSLGVSFQFAERVHAIGTTGRSTVGPGEVKTHNRRVKGHVVVNAAGLYADVLAARFCPDMRVLPFRGSYAELVPTARHLVQSHIYAAPGPDFPFLGVHLSRRTDGRVLVGPGALLALGREAQSMLGLRGGGLGRTLAWPGFWRLAVTKPFRRLALQEIAKSWSLGRLAAEARALVPGLDRAQLVRAGSGNRAQMVDRAGHLVDDIVVRTEPGAVHVLNAVSPGLTCSLPFGRHVAALAQTAMVS